MDRLKQTVEKIARRSRRAVIAAAVLTPLAFVILWRLNHALNSGPLDWSLPLVVVVGSHLWAIPLLGLRQAGAAGDALRLRSLQGDLLEFCRRDVERRLRLERSARWVLPFAGAAVVVNILILSGPADASFLTAAAIVACGLCLLRAGLAFRRTPQLRRELAELA